MYHGLGGLRGKIVRHFYTRDRRPVALVYAYLAGILKTRGHSVRYVVDRPASGADLYVFNPSLITLDLERQQIERLRRREPTARVLVVGLAASVLPRAFDALGVTVIQGEAEQLHWKLDEVLDRPGEVVPVGTVEDLDRLPLPDWSLFSPQRFRIAYDFWRFPTALVQQSRGCTFRCNYCPYIILENRTRFRDPAMVVEEIHHDMRRWGFRSFKFRDPLFGLSPPRVLELAERIGRLPRRIQFSVETRIDLMKPETLKLLKEVGLTSITVGIETPDDATLRRYRRAPIRDDRQRQFIALCRELGIRTVAGFMIGFPDDTVKSIRRVLNYAKMLNPTFANFNIVTPYPGTGFYEEVKDQIIDRDYSHYSVYRPVLACRSLSGPELQQLHAKCFTSYYFRIPYLQQNAPLLWPALQRLGMGAKKAQADGQTPSAGDGASHGPSTRTSFSRRQDRPHGRSRPAGGDNQFPREAPGPTLGRSGGGRLA